MSKRVDLPDWPQGMPKRQAASYIGASVRHLERLVADGRVAPRRDGRRLLFLRAELDRYLTSLPTAKPNDVSRPGS